MKKRRSTKAGNRAAASEGFRLTLRLTDEEKADIDRAVARLNEELQRDRKRSLTTPVVTRQLVLKMLIHSLGEKLSDRKAKLIETYLT